MLQKPHLQFPTLLDLLAAFEPTRYAVETAHVVNSRRHSQF